MSDLSEHFWTVIKETPFFIGDHIVSNLVTKKQNLILNRVQQALEGNKIEEKQIQSFGGKLNQEKFAEYRKNLENRIQMDNKSHEHQDQLLKWLDRYLNLINEKVKSTCILKIPVKQLPIPELCFMTHSKIINTENNPDKMKLSTLGYSFHGKIHGIVPNPAVALFYKGPIKKDFFFAPIRKEQINRILKRNMIWSDIVEWNMESNKQTANILDILISNKEFDGWTESFEKFNKIEEREGNPYCSFLNADKDLTTSLNSLITSEKFVIKNHYSPVAFVIPNKSGSIILAIRDVPENMISYEGIMKTTLSLCYLGSASYEFPKTKLIKKKVKSPSTSQSTVRNTEPKFEIWSQEELNKLAENRGIINLPTWNEADLEELALKRGIITLPEWSENELEEFNNQREIPEVKPNWIPEPNMKECPQCGYALQQDWTQCPICEYNIDINNLEGKNDKMEKNDFWEPPG